MLDPNHLENLAPDLLKSILEPLFEDFLHWYGQTQTILETRSLDLFSEQEQAELLQKVTESIQEVKAARALFVATDGRAGVDTRVVKAWHQLVTQCWNVIIHAGKSEA